MSCLEKCPSGALGFSADGAFRITIDRKSCISCGACVRVCPSGALEFDGREAESEELVNELLLDRSFFEESGGGVTLSGGDPVFQPRFALDILKRLKEAGIHTALESSLYCSRKILESFLPYVDLFISDCKVFSDELHTRYTGVSNQQIIKNITYLLGTSEDVLIRIPLIPVFTATDGNVRNIIGFLQSHGCRVLCEFLNYNPLGMNKYRLRNIDRTVLEKLRPLPTEQIARWEKMATSLGIDIVSETMNGDKI
jgi:pyruvate formate lyase activating enzyme